jgi:hypothetical protein
MKRVSRSLPRNIRELERLVPIGDENAELINSMIKEEYTHQVTTWALANYNSKRKVLWAFLNAEPRRNFTQTNTEGFSTASHLPSLVIESGTCRMNLNTCFSGQPSSRKINTERFASVGTDDVFHKTPPSVPALNLTPTKRSEESFARHIARRFLTPLGLSKVEPIVDEYTDLLEEMSLMLEKTQNTYPYDHLYTHPTMSPQSARVVTKAKDEEDHLNRPSYDPKPPSTPRTQGARVKYVVKTGDSTHRYYYGMDYRCGAEPSISRPMKPLEISQCFASFPAETHPLVYPVSDVIRQQAFTNTRMGKDNKAIFEAETCL